MEAARHITDGIKRLEASNRPCSRPPIKLRRVGIWQGTVALCGGVGRSGTNHPGRSLRYDRRGPNASHSGGRRYDPNAKRHKTTRRGRRGEDDRDLGSALLRARKLATTTREDVELTSAGVSYYTGTGISIAMSMTRSAA